MGSISTFSATIRGASRAQKVTATLMIVFVVIVAAGVITLTAGTDYTAASEQICTRTDGQRSCSDPQRSFALLSVFFGIPTDDARVRSEALVIASRVLIASVVPFIVGGYLLARSYFGPSAED